MSCWLVARSNQWLCVSWSAAGSDQSQVSECGLAPAVMKGQTQQQSLKRGQLSFRFRHAASCRAYYTHIIGVTILIAARFVVDKIYWKRSLGPLGGTWKASSAFTMWPESTGCFWIQPEPIILVHFRPAKLEDAPLWNTNETGAWRTRPIGWKSQWD